MRSLRTRTIALNGVLGALAVICLLLANILPTNTLSLYALSSFFISIAIIESGIKAGWVFYAASSLLSSIIVPDKILIVPYALFFGLYGIVKFYIEKLDRIIIEYILKFVYFNVCVGIVIAFVSGVFQYMPALELPWYVLIAAAEIVFFIYDYVYTLFINYYKEKLKGKIKSD